MPVKIIDRSEAFIARLTKAIADNGGGLDAASRDLGDIMKESMYSSGATDLPDDTPVKDQPASAVGSPPSVKTGRLARSIVNARTGQMAWSTGTNVVYARIHEFGGSINHPGGTHWTMTKNGPKFVSERRALTMALKGRELKRTKAHTIIMPARPFMRPALFNNRARIQRVFIAKVREKMGATT